MTAHRFRPPWSIVEKPMSPRNRETFEPVTLGHIRGHGCRALLVYCGSMWCNHSARIEADWLSDDTVPPTLGPRMVCVRPAA